MWAYLFTDINWFEKWTVSQEQSSMKTEHQGVDVYLEEKLNFLPFFFSFLQWPSMVTIGNQWISIDGCQLIDIDQPIQNQ